ncbi:MAG TPA: fatty acid desaturase [Polyangiaceae bacterium]|nr:fatty acid desaturase [Polyangiaceae bacterium]
MNQLSSRPGRAREPSLGPRRSDARTALVVSGHFLLTFAPIWIAAWARLGWWTLGCWLWFGLLAHGFHLVLHELIHKLLFQRVRWNEWLAHWVIAPLFFADFEAFRRRHWAHHRMVGTNEDPKYTYRIDIGGWRFISLAVSMLTVVGAARKFSLQVGDQGGGSSGSRRRAMVAVSCVQFGMVASVVGAARLGHPENWLTTGISAAAAYGFVYMYGIAGLTVWMTTLRGIAEHRPSGPGDLMERDAALRNFTHGTIERLLFGAYGFSDHATHHRHPAVPCSLLHELTTQLAAEDATLAPVGSHFSVLSRLARGRPIVPHEVTGAGASATEFGGP